MDKYQRIDFRDQISKNKWKSFFLMMSIFIVIVLTGYAISFAFNPEYFYIIMIVAIVISITYLMINYYNSDKIALASVQAKKASKKEYKEYYSLVEGLTIASGLPMPKLYVMPSSQINAFASGRNPENAVVCVTEGALKKLEKRELEGVLAHELSHIANYDIRFMTFVAVMVGMVAIISELFLRSLWFGSGGDSREKNNWIFMIIAIVLAVLAPIAVWLIQMSISRKREFAADASAVKFTRYPAGLINALKKIKYDSPLSAEEEKRQIVSKAIAPLFISNPFKSSKFKGLGSSHPPLEKRIKVLERM